MEWKRETSFQDLVRRFVNRGGRRFSRDLLGLSYLLLYILWKGGSGKVPHFGEYGSVTPKIGAFLGGATYLPQKVSGNEKREW